MIGTSLWDYVFIRSCIFFLHSIAPLSILYSVVILFIRPKSYRIPWYLEAWILAETAFFTFVYLPRNYYLQHAATHPTTFSRNGRRQLFKLCHDTVPDPEQYLSKWFKKAPRSEIKRDNVKEFFCWAFLNKGDYGPEDNEELEEYVNKMEVLLGRQLDGGRGNAECLRLTLDKVDMLHRSLTWYLCVFVVDTITYVYMLWHSFHFHRLALSRFLTVFPFRPLTTTSPYRSPAKTLSYWHRPHTSKTSLPILFIHGIGIGLYPYVNFLAELNSANKSQASDGEVGIIAIEIMSMSFRITHSALEKDEMCNEIQAILKTHGWEKCVLISHSYGSVISTHLLHHPILASRIGPMLLIDPVSFLLHLPDVAYNFTCRRPKRANEYQLYYFASKDMGVSHTLSRRFFWSENILWKHDIEGHRVTVALSGKDLIVDSTAVRRYLTEEKSAGLDVLWFKDLDHAQVFDSKRDRDILVGVVRKYCAQGQTSKLSGEGLEVVEPL
ncbi:MAG: hypothetical protein M1830_008414 [Pleopsidium flavum]|nr:MAG: hypothetical protein M1830_008414 [Pleopsidium flavum]